MQSPFDHGTVRGSARAHFGNSYQNYYGTVHQNAASDTPLASGTSNSKIRDALEFDDMDMRRATIELPHGSTCQWFFDSPEYQKWRDNTFRENNHGFLWIRGKPGAGKSTLMRLAVKHADRRFPDDLRISFFFNAKGSVLERSIEGMYRSFLYQLLVQCPALESNFDEREWNDSNWPAELLEELFRDCVLQLGARKLTCHIDALDECEESDVRSLVEFFEDLGSMATSAGTQMHVCFASRHYPRISISKCVHLLLDKLEGHQEDIQTYIRNNLKVPEPALRNRLAAEITTRANDVFLWVVLVVRCMNNDMERGASRSHLLAVLDVMPAGMQYFLENSIKRGAGDSQYLMPILLLILFSRRPLSPLELFDAVLHARDGRGGGHVPPRSQIAEFILNTSKGFAETIVPQKNSLRPRVQFIHQTIGEYLHQIGIGELESSFCENPTGMSHDFLKSICVEYISFAARTLQHTEIPLDPSDRKESYFSMLPFLEYALEGSITHAELAQAHGVSQVAFVEAFPLEQVVKLSNFVLGDDEQSSQYPPGASKAYIFDVSNAPQLLQLELSKGKSEPGQSKATDLTESMPDLTMGSSDRYDPGGVYEHADSIRTDNEDNNLGFDEQLSYSNVFVRELREGLDEVLRSKHCDDHARKRMSAALPDLLKAYALSLACRARPGFEKKTVTFIRHTRIGIAKSFRDEILAMPTQAGVPEWREKMELLSKVSHPDMPVDDDSEGIYLTEDEIFVPKPRVDLEDEVEQAFDISGAEEIDLARTFMIHGGNDFKWLLRRIRTAAGLMTTGTTEARIRNEMLEIVGSNSEFTLDIDWSPVNFMTEQYSTIECRLQDVICLCGTEDDVEALSCGEYADNTWPGLGLKLLECVSDAVGISAGTNRAVLCEFDTVEAEITTAHSGTTIRLRGDVPALIESSTFFVWLSTAVRAAPQDKVACCTPELQRVGASSCRVTYRYAQPPRKTDLTCWHGMFRNPVIAEGYPITPRSTGEQGLEVSFPMMATLAQTPYLTCFGGASILKGFSTILSLTKRAGSSFTWHFLIDQQRRRMPYNEGLNVTEVREQIAECDLQSGRHFVGWTPCIDVLAGTAHANYDVDQTGQFPYKPPAVSIANVTIGISKIASLGVTLVPGKKDIPDALHDMRPTKERITAALDWTVLFYDVTTKQAWLLGGPSALLHICRAWLSSEPAGILLKESPVDPISVFRHANAQGGMSEAVDLLLDDHNRAIKLYSTNVKSTIESSMEYFTQNRKLEKKTSASWHTWGDVVESRALALEHLHDHQVEQQSKRTANVRVPSGQQHMKGYDFQDIMKLKPTIQEWNAQIMSSSGGWIDFAEACNAVPIFGQGFGDLLRPTRTKASGHQICLQKTPLPQGKDYMAVSVEVLGRLTKQHRKGPSHCVRLGHSTYWLDPEAAFAPCTCNETACRISIATLASLELPPAQTSLSLGQLFLKNRRGAVIFPCTPNRLKKSPPHKSPQQRSLSSREVEDARAGAEMEDLNGSPHPEVHPTRGIKDTYDEEDLQLAPASWRAELLVAVQHRNDRELLEDAGNQDQTNDTAAAELPESFDGTGSDNSRHQAPRLRKVKASPSLRE